MKTFLKILALGSSCLALLNACASEPTEKAQPALPTIELRAPQATLTAEVADEAQERQVGLMHRKMMAFNHGMLFVFDEATQQCMWMRNTLIDLEVAFMDSKGLILNIEPMKKLTLDTHCSRGDALFALETNPGWFESAGLKQGQQLRLPAEFLTPEFRKSRRAK